MAFLSNIFYLCHALYWGLEILMRDIHNIEAIRAEYPILSEKVNGKPLVYFDNAATNQKPNCVVDTLSRYYHSFNSNIHRGVHHLSNVATGEFEAARECVRSFIGAKHKEEIIFTRGTTESLNLLSYSLVDYLCEKISVQTNSAQTNCIAISAMEHHSNTVPWQMAAKRHNLSLEYIGIDKNGNLNLEEAKKVLSKKPLLLSICHASNVLGTVNPIEELCKLSHQNNCLVVIDGAQAIAHQKLDVQKIDCDFYCFSGHKMYAPLGIGVLYGKKELLENMPPFLFGGEMIEEVNKQETTFNELPYKFEAGTPPIAEAIGLKTAIEYLESFSIENIAKQEAELLSYATNKMREIEGLEIYGLSSKKAPVISFNIKGIYHYDLGVLLDQMGIAVRTGHHCAQVLMDELNINGCLRASFAIYNTKAEIDCFVEAVKKACNLLK